MPVINEMVLEVLEVAISVVPHVVPLDQEAVPAVVAVLPYLDQSLAVEVVSCPAVEAWVAPRTVEDHEKVVLLPFQEGEVEGPLVDQVGIFPEGQVGHWVVWDLLMEVLPFLPRRHPHHYLLHQVACWASHQEYHHWPDLQPWQRVRP